ncbi:MAG TPA: phosphodiesterase, partial [Geminicoccaceae bacterium]|nr:phosphodiesterase [Geminicoccaceae bacterium]
MANPAGHDLTTGLPGRLLLHDRLAQALAQSRRHHGVLALIRIDLEGLEPCDDPPGEGGRDRLLRKVATQLRAQLRASDTIGRIEAGFVLILPDLSDGQAADLVAGKIAAILDDGLAVEGRTLRLRASLGIAVFPGHGDSPAQLLRNVGIAAADARAAGVRLQRFAGATPQPLELRHDLTRDLGRAIEQGQLRLEYQPQIELSKGRPVGFEALLRWRHPSRGDVAPDIFVEVAEASGQIGRIGKWTLTQACAAAASWPLAPYGPLRLAVNFSALQTAGDDFPLVVARALEGSRLAAARLELEVTERSVLDRERVTAVLARLRAMGVRLALDDFGMGFAGLRHLGELPLDALKIDRSFVAGLASPPGHAIVQCVVELAHRMGLRVVAEGIESDSQLATLRSLGCDEGQGHVLGRPLAAAEV